MNNDPTQPSGPEQPELGELRGRLRGQWKAERRAEEREALREHWLQRDLIDAVTEAMHRGDHVTITLPGDRVLSGRIVATGRDYALLRTDQRPSRDFAVRLADADRRRAGDPYAGPQLLVAVTEGTPTDGPVESPDAPATFQALLHQYDFEQQADLGRKVELGTTLHPRGLVGRLRAHAWDHLYVTDATSSHLFVPVGAVTYIAWSSHTPQVPD